MSDTEPSADEAPELKGKINRINLNIEKAPPKPKAKRQQTELQKQNILKAQESKKQKNLQRKKD